MRGCTGGTTKDSQFAALSSFVGVFWGTYERPRVLQRLDLVPTGGCRRDVPSVGSGFVLSMGDIVNDRVGGRPVDVYGDRQRSRLKV